MPALSPRCQSLVTLGAPDSVYRDPWPDYLKLYGFTDQDVPELLMMVADPRYDEFDEHDPEVWAPLHAWRVLGQLRNPTVVRPLTRLFPRLCEDDSALSELCLVFGLIGPAAIPPLARRWQQPAQEQFVQVLAMDALTQVALQHPESRAQVLDVFRDYLAAPSAQQRTLNGLLVANLLDLQAIECIDSIREMYRRNIVDISCAGDIEDVEIELGLRDARETPKPDYSLRDEELADNGVVFDSDAIDATDSVDVLEKFLSYYANDSSISGVSELDGFFAALACAPQMIAPSQWMAKIWGGQSQMPEWESEDEFRVVVSALMNYHNQVMEYFHDGNFKPLFLGGKKADGSESLIVEDWCEGFARGLSVWGEMPPSQMEKLISLIEPIRLFITAEGYAALKNMSDDDVLQQQHKITDNVRRIYKAFFRPLPAKPPAREPDMAAQKAGRNDPCPCGSGKKFKKCCLQ
jgi:yecA family protein